jgi:hypothetical protein
MSNIEFDFSGLDEANGDLDRAIDAFLHDVDGEIQMARRETVTFAQEKVRVDTGKTKNSIKDKAEYLGFEVEASEAAQYLELGTRKMGPYPFLRPSVRKAGQRLKQRLARL